MKSTRMVHLILSERVNPGDRVVDATAGNGHDTLKLAQLCGAGGKVFAFDIQEAALASTRDRLIRAGLISRVRLIQAGHDQLADWVSSPVKAIVFNLGYLPGGDKSIITKPTSTIAALEQSLNLLSDEGVLCVTVYPGHTGGRQEAEAVDALFIDLDPKLFSLGTFKGRESPQNAPYVHVLERT